MTMSRDQLRAARILLCLSQEELAALSDVGVATIRRFETGQDIGAARVETLRDAVEAAGIVLLKGERVSGRATGDGVALVAEKDLPSETLRRMSLRVRSDAESTGKAGRPPKKRA